MVLKLTFTKIKQLINYIFLFLKKVFLRKDFFLFKIASLLILFFLISFSHAINISNSFDNFNSASDLLLNANMLNISLNLFTEINILGDFNKGSLLLYWYPKEDINQRVFSLRSNFPFKETSNNKGDYLLFSFNKNNKNIFLSLNSTLITKKNIVPIKKKISFPLTFSSKERDYLMPYLMPTKIIDKNKEIKSLANNIIRNTIRKEYFNNINDIDLYEVIFNLATWVNHNIRYNLTSSTADASYSSSWVLKNRNGVCDELTALFISLNRALGIPARFVSGLAFSNINSNNYNKNFKYLFNNNFNHPSKNIIQLNEMLLKEGSWGPHGWAEVYFPSIGWVPFDVTYGEYGWVDATHIKLDTNYDVKKSSIEFKGSGSDFKIITNPLSYFVFVNNYSFFSNKISSSIEVYSKDITYNSFNLIIVDLYNPNNYYVSTRLLLSNTSGLVYYSNTSLDILLKPYEKKKVYFLVKVNNLNKDYSYEFPIIVFDGFNNLKTSFSVSPHGAFFKRDFFQDFFIKNKFSDLIDLNCSTKEYYLEGKININCSLSFNGFFKGKICFENLSNCNQLGFSHKTFFHFITNKKTGFYTIPIFITGNNIFEKKYLLLNVVNDSNLRIIIDNLDACSLENINKNLSNNKLNNKKESTVNILNNSFCIIPFEKRKNIVFSLNSNVPVDLINVSISNGFFIETWSNPKINNKFSFSFYGKQLVPGINELKLIVYYKDYFGKLKRSEKILFFKPQTTFLWQKSYLYLNKLNFFIEKLYEKISKLIFNIN